MKYIFTSTRLLVSVLALALFAVPVAAKDEKAREQIIKHSENRPLQSLQVSARSSRFGAWKPGPPREIINYRGAPQRISEIDRSVSAAIVQDAQGTGTTAVGAGFPGASNVDNGNVLGFIVAPPDPDMDVGPNHVVQMINLLTTIYDKSGNVITAPFPSNAFWSGVGGNCEPNNQGDPIVLYDEQADRWIVSQFAFPDSLSTFSQCVAVSQTGDPTGGYNRYEFSFDSFGFNDYPKHGISSDSITMMANLFQQQGPFGFSFAGSFLGVMDKAAMYAGNPADLIGFNVGTGEFGFISGDLDGSGTAPNLFATAMSQQDRFDIWQLDVDWTASSANVSRTESIPVTPFDADLCAASRETCIPQPENGPALEAISDRLMQRLQIRDFGSYRTMVTGHTIDVGNGRAGVRWYEFRETGGSWSLYQEGTFAPNDGENRWMTSVAMNAAGDLGLGYLIASENTFLSIGLAGQSAAASGSGLLDSEEQICAAGSGVQTDTGRSGDYSATVIDPVTDTFWHTSELVVNTGQFNWATFICEFAVGSGAPVNQAPIASFTSNCTDLSCSFDGSASSDSDGAIVSYDWDFGDGTTATGVNASHTYAAEGSFNVTLTVTDDGGATGSDTRTVTVSDGINNPPVATFAFDCSTLNCNFDGSGSSDSDGTIASYAWDFGDGATGSGATSSHTYAAGGDFNVTLTVTDDAGATDSDVQTVTVADVAFTLDAIGYKVRGRQKADLTWSGAGSTNVDVIRDGVIVATTANDGFFTDNIDRRGSATYILVVCEAGTSTCSNQTTVDF